MGDQHSPAEAYGEIGHDLSWTEMRYPEHGYSVVRIVVPDAALTNPLLDGFDLAVLRDCEGEGRTIADKVLALETVVRRYEQAVQTDSSERDQ